ncbi:hypothetical protein [Vagococcus carniphilus]|uniref:Uncharacterized protein n=1 Tax=Vagococcus carniphilus TaxID=218144 RepID=A0A430B033_9ENTE|nr:hypothetical protein [Vagococcus carniphilus]QNN73052.1 hypothetical protein H9L18_14590 [Vagococcus carniphilus]RSU13700.1 hypothetical protein CBF28_09455 [Vagococcus carniphilus]
MMIEQFFKIGLDRIHPHLGNISLIMGIIAIICLVLAGGMALRKKHQAKWFGLTGFLLLINPAIYFFTN